MQYNKLVRDKIPEIIERNGDSAKVHTANDSEYLKKLKEKLLEEVKEFSKEETEEELADILEVIEALSEFKKFDKTKVLSIKESKATKSGKFAKRIILERTKINKNKKIKNFN